MATAQVLPIQSGRVQHNVAQMRGTNKNFGAVRALVNFNFNVRAGVLTALLGPNGAGKTTAIKLLLGLAGPTSGRISVLGSDPSGTPTVTRVGAMPQVCCLPDTWRVR